MVQVLKYFVNLNNFVVFSFYLLFATLLGGKFAFFSTIVGTVLTLVIVIVVYSLVKFIIFTKRCMSMPAE